MFRLHQLVRCFAAAVLGGCFTYPCERDVVACAEDDAFEIDRACELDDELAAVLCEGEGELSPLGAHGWPIVHHGPQGGVHFVLGLQLDGVDAGHDAFQIEIEARDCDGACETSDMLATRTFVIDREHSERSGAAAEIADIVMVLEHSPRAQGELVVRVTDSCGRVATVTREID
jgi:hypothetical protein